jgi:O-antigen/teichoic acid export membrane protein
MIALADQAIVSVVTFATGILVARASGDATSPLALYFLGLTLWLLAGEIGFSLVSTPHMLRLPRLSGERMRVFNGSMLGIQLGLVLLITLAAAIAAGLSLVIRQIDMALMLLLSGVAVAPITLRNFARQMCFARRESSSAFVLDASVSALQLLSIVALFVLDHLNWMTALASIAIANVAGCLGFFVLRSDQFSFDRRRCLIDLRRSWITSRWLLASSLTWTAGTHLYPWVIALLAERAQASVWGVCYQLASIGNPLVMAIQNVLGPQIAHARVERDAEGFRRYVVRAMLGFGALVLPVAVGMSVFASQLLGRIYGSAYAVHDHIAQTLLMAVVFMAVSFAASRGLFGLRRADLDFYANFLPILSLVLVGTWLIPIHGARGAAIALLVGLGLACAFRTIAFLRVTSRPLPEVRMAVGGVS